MTSLRGPQVEPKARLGLDHTGPHPSLFLWSPLTRAAARWFMVSQVPGTKVTGGDDRSVSDTQQAQNPCCSLS